MCVTAVMLPIGEMLFQTKLPLRDMDGSYTEKIHKIVHNGVLNVHLCDFNAFFDKFWCFIAKEVR